MGSGNTCNCGSIERRHLDYECSLKAIDPIMYPDGWNSIVGRQVDRVEVNGTAVNIITKSDVPNPSISCHHSKNMTDDNHPFVGLTPPFMSPRK